MAVLKLAAISFILLTYFLKNGKTSMQKEEGDKCNATTFEGMCKHLVDCPDAIDAIRRRQMPQICGFSGQTPIVCCRLSENAPAATTATTISASSLGIKSFEKCKEYGEYYFEYVQRIPLIPSEHETIKVNRCRKNTNFLPRHHAQPEEYPFLAALGYQVGNELLWKCAGTLISEKYVLTAASCTLGKYGSPKRVRLSDFNFNHLASSVSTNLQEFDIAEIIRHPEFLPPSRYHDIALLRVDRGIKLGSKIIPACLRWNPVITEARSIAVEWDFDEYSNSTLLNEAISDLIEDHTCNATYADHITTGELQHGVLPDIQLCARQVKQTNQDCQEIAGTPLVVYSKEVHCMDSLIGITTYPASCKTSGLYTRVSSYRKWIEDIIW